MPPEETEASPASQPTTLTPESGSTLSQQPVEKHTSVESWQASLPTELRKHQSIQKFNDVSDLAKSYVEVESMVGRKGVVLPDEKNPEDKGRFFNQLGRPETPEGYADADFAPPTDGTPYNEDWAETGRMRELFHEVGLTQEQVTKFQAGMKDRAGDFLQRTQLSQEVSRDGAIRALREKFGNAYDDRVLQAQQAIRMAAGESADSIVEMKMSDGTMLGDNPQLIEMFANIGAKMSEHGLVGGKRPGVPTMDPLTAQQKLTELMSDNDYLSALNTKTHPGHELAVKQRSDLFNAMHPEGPQ